MFILILKMKMRRHVSCFVFIVSIVVKSQNLTNNETENTETVNTVTRNTQTQNTEVKSNTTAWIHSDFMQDSFGKLQLFLDPETKKHVYVVKKTGERVNQETVDETFSKAQNTTATKNDSTQEKLIEKSTFVLNPFTREPELYMNPSNNQWVMLNASNHARIKLKSQPPNKPVYPSASIWKNLDTGKNAFFYNGYDTKWEFIDQISGMRFDASTEYFQEEYNTVAQRKIDMERRREDILQHLKKNQCGELWYMFDPTTKVQVFLDQRTWAAVPVLSIGEFPIYAPVFVEEFSWLASLEKSSVVPDTVPSLDGNEGCFYVDESTGQQYSTSHYLVPILPKPTDLLISTDLFTEFTDWDDLGLEIAGDFEKTIEGMPKEYVGVNPKNPGNAYFRLQSNKHYVSAERFTLEMIRIGLKNEDFAHIRHVQLARPRNELKAIIPGSADDLSTVLPAKKPITNPNLIFFQLQEKSASAYINQVLSNLAGINAFKLVKPPKNAENSQVDNESVLKTYVSTVSGNQTHAKGYNLLGGVDKFMIVKDHVYFNFTKYGVASPSWITVHSVEKRS